MSEKVPELDTIIRCRMFDSPRAPLARQPLAKALQQPLSSFACHLRLAALCTSRFARPLARSARDCRPVHCAHKSASNFNVANGHNAAHWPRYVLDKGELCVIVIATDNWLDILNIIAEPCESDAKWRPFTPINDGSLPFFRTSAAVDWERSRGEGRIAAHQYTNEFDCDICNDARFFRPRDPPRSPVVDSPPLTVRQMRRTRSPVEKL